MNVIDFLENEFDAAYLGLMETRKRSPWASIVYTTTMVEIRSQKETEIVLNEYQVAWERYLTARDKLREGIRQYKSAKA